MTTTSSSPRALTRPQAKAAPATFGQERALKRLGLYAALYAPLKSSIIYETYLRAVRRDLLEKRRRETDFYRRALGWTTPGGMVFDIGANEGEKAEVFRRLPARVVCFEPDVDCVEFLRRRFRRKRHVEVVGQAVSNRAQRVQFHSFQAGSALNTLSTKWVEVLGDQDNPRFGAAAKPTRCYEVEAVTLDSLLDRYGPAFFVKIASRVTRSTSSAGCRGLSRFSRSRSTCPNSATRDSSA